MAEKKVVLGLLGLGNIGGGVWDLIREFGGELEKRTGVSLKVKKALVLDKKVHGGKEVPEEVLTTEAAEKFNHQAQLFLQEPVSAQQITLE